MAKSTPRTRGKESRKQIETEYLGYFVPPPPTWHDEHLIDSLEQPSHLKWVPSETTYGVEPSVDAPAMVDA